MFNHATTEVFLDDVVVPADALVGEEGKGFRYILDGMNAERILIASECVGDGRWFVEQASRYASERMVFGRPIGQNQGVQFPIARAHAAVEAAGLMRDRAARLFDEGLPCAADANTAKLLASEASWAAANACVDTFGGYGFAADYDVERKFRETRLYSVAPVSNNLVLAYIGTTCSACRSPTSLSRRPLRAHRLGPHLSDSRRHRRRRPLGARLRGRAGRGGAQACRARGVRRRRRSAPHRSRAGVPPRPRLRGPVRGISRSACPARHAGARPAPVRARRGRVPRRRAHGHPLGPAARAALDPRQCALRDLAPGRSPGASALATTRAPEARGDRARDDGRSPAARPGSLGTPARALPAAALRR